MTTLDQELLDIALQGLANTKTRVDTLDESHSNLQTLVTKTIKNTNDFNSKLGSLSKDFTSKLNAIPTYIPKDGQDGKQGLIGPPGESIKGDQGVTGDQGDQGLPGEPGVPGINGKDGLDSLPGKDGKDGKQGAIGKRGSNGTGIKNIVSKNDSILITLTDGSNKSIKIPKVQVPAGPTTVPTEIVTLKHLADTNINTAKDGDVLTKEGKKWVSKTPAITDYSNLPELTNPVATDFMVLLRNNIPYKVSIETLSNLFGGVLPVSLYPSATMYPAADLYPGTVADTTVYPNETLYPTGG